MKYFNSDVYCNDQSENLYYFFASLPEVNPENYNIIFNKFIDVPVAKSTINRHAPIIKLSRKIVKLN